MAEAGRLTNPVWPTYSLVRPRRFALFLEDVNSQFIYRNLPNQLSMLTGECVADGKRVRLRISRETKAFFAVHSHFSWKDERIRAVLATPEGEFRSFGPTFQVT